MPTEIKIQCECGNMVSKSNISKHILKSKVHAKKMLAIGNAEPQEFENTIICHEVKTAVPKAKVVKKTPVKKTPKKVKIQKKFINAITRCNTVKIINITHDHLEVSKPVVTGDKQKELQTIIDNCVNLISDLQVEINAYKKESELCKMDIPEVSDDFTPWVSYDNCPMVCSFKFNEKIRPSLDMIYKMQTEEETMIEQPIEMCTDTSEINTETINEYNDLFPTMEIDETTGDTTYFLNMKALPACMDKAFAVSDAIEHIVKTIEEATIETCTDTSEIKSETINVHAEDIPSQPMNAIDEFNDDAPSEEKIKSSILKNDIKDDKITKRKRSYDASKKRQNEKKTKASISQLFEEEFDETKPYLVNLDNGSMELKNYKTKIFAALRWVEESLVDCFHIEYDTKIIYTPHKNTISLLFIDIETHKVIIKLTENKIMYDKRILYNQHNDNGKTHTTKHILKKPLSIMIEKLKHEAISI